MRTGAFGASIRSPSRRARVRSRTRRNRSHLWCLTSLPRPWDIRGPYLKVENERRSVTTSITCVDSLFPSLPSWPYQTLQPGLLVSVHEARILCYMLILRVVPAGIAAALFQASIYDVPGGYRAVMFDRFSGVKDKVSHRDAFPQPTHADFRV